jgi:hypothetical protein
LKLTNNLHLVHSVLHKDNFTFVAVRKTVRHISKINGTYQQTRVCPSGIRILVSHDHENNRQHLILLIR